MNKERKETIKEVLATTDMRVRGFRDQWAMALIGNGGLMKTEDERRGFLSCLATLNMLTLPSAFDRLPEIEHFQTGINLIFQYFQLSWETEI